MITNNSNYKAKNQTLNVFNNPQPLNIPFAPQHLHDNIIISTGKPSNITSFNPIVNQKDLPRTIQIVINNNNPISQSSKGERPLPTPNLLRSYFIDPSLLCSPKSIDKIPALSLHGHDGVMQPYPTTTAITTEQMTLHTQIIIFI